MTNRERIITSFNHKQPDICPYSIGMTIDERKKVNDYLGRDFYDTFQTPLNSIMYDPAMTPTPNKPGHVTDYFGVEWNRTIDKDIGTVEGFVIPEPTMKNYKFPEIDYDRLRERVKNVSENSGDKFRTFYISFSTFERAWTLRGMENLLMDMILHPSFVEELLGKICEFNLKLIDVALEYEIDGLFFGDDWGQQKGLITGPKLWRKFIKPVMKKQYAKAKDKGLYVIQHTCGDIGEIMPDLIDIGLDCYNTFQPELYDIHKVKKEYGNDLTFFGGLSTQQFLPYATAEQVKDKTIEMIRTMGKNGGYIAAPTHSVPGDVPAENVIAMAEVMQNQDKYI